MSAQMSVTQTRLTRCMDERAATTKLHEDMLAHVEGRDDKELTDVERETIKGYRLRAEQLDLEIKELGEALKREQDSVAASKLIRTHLASDIAGVEADGEDVVYKRFSTYARDSILVRSGTVFDSIMQRAGGPDVRNQARERLTRTPANTLSSDVEGLIPEQHIAQIFQVIDASRPLVASATRVSLQRGRLSYPKITQRPVVAVQATEKTEAGNQSMQVDMEETTASTYLGGGDLSWQAIEWSTPDALELWFRLAASDYALKTEQDAGEVLQSAGFLNNISTTLDGTDSYADWIAAIVAGAGEVYTNSGRIADTLYMSPDRFYAFAALQTDAPAVFVNGALSLGGQGGAFAGLSIVVSRGLDSGVAIVGDSDALLVAETAGAPVQLRVVEPAIGGVEVGIIGAFESVVVEDEAFSLLTTAS